MSPVAQLVAGSQERRQRRQLGSHEGDADATPPPNVGRTNRQALSPARRDQPAQLVPRRTDTLGLQDRPGRGCGNSGCQCRRVGSDTPASYRNSTGLDAKSCNEISRDAPGDFVEAAVAEDSPAQSAKVGDKRRPGGRYPSVDTPCCHPRGQRLRDDLLHLQRGVAGMQRHHARGRQMGTATAHLAPMSAVQFSHAAAGRGDEINTCRGHPLQALARRAPVGEQALVAHTDKAPTQPPPRQPSPTIVGKASRAKP
jgi:hypothetical protein